MTGRALSHYLMILVIIGSFPIVSTLQLPPKAMAQTPSEAARVLVDDVIQALKSNDTSRAEAHLNILNQQLPTFVNSSSIQSVKVLLDDATLAIKNNNINNAMVHLNLIKQQFRSAATSAPSIKSTLANNTLPSEPQLNRLSTYKNPTYGITTVQYPSGWTINETNWQVTNDSVGVVEFLPPEAKNLPGGQTPALVQIFIDTPEDPQVASNLSSYIRNEMTRMANSSYFSIISANTTAKLAGLPAFSKELKQLNFDNIWLEIQTIISGKVLTVKYLADSPNFSKYLPAAMKIINSIKIDKSPIEHLLPTNATESIGEPSIAKIKSNHPPVAYGDNVTVTSESQIHIKLRANDVDHDPIKFSIDEQTSEGWGSLEDFNPNTGDVTYKPMFCHFMSCTDSFTFRATDSHNATSNTGYYQVKINP